MKSFHKSKVDGLEKLPTRACLFYDLLHFKGCHFTQPGFTQILAIGISNFLAFLTCLMVPIKISCHLSRHNFLLHSILKNYTVTHVTPVKRALDQRKNRIWVCRSKGAVAKKYRISFVDGPLVGPLVVICTKSTIFFSSYLRTNCQQLFETARN